MYERKQTVKAVYADKGSGNPLIDALPESYDNGTFKALIMHYPKVPPNGGIKDLIQLQTLFIPLDYMYEVYKTLVRMIESTYHTRTSKENLRRTNSMLLGIEEKGEYGIQAQSGSILGVAGIGKSSTVQRCLDLIPQVIEHEKFHGGVFYTKQVLWLYVQCPSDASAKSFCFNVVKALDEALGTNHLDYMFRMKASANSAAVTYIKILCLTYNIGLIVVDEIQNLVITAKRDNRIKPLIKFLTELTNDSATSVLFCGTELSETVFIQEEYLKRRTRGLRLLPFKPDGVYREFLMQLWKYQYTKMEAPFTDRIANVIYDITGGIPAYMVKLFEESQRNAISEGMLMIDEKIIRSTASRIALTPPKEFSCGNWLSDFKCASNETLGTLESMGVNFLKTEEKRLYANQRGRRAVKRDERDLICAYKDNWVMSILKEFNMIEEEEHDNTLSNSL